MEQDKASKCGVIISSSLLVFTFCIFGPFQLYITNASELFFSFGDIWWICVILSLIFELLAIIIGLILKKNGENIIAVHCGELRLGYISKEILFRQIMVP